MAVRANKPAFNIREKLKELTSKFGLKGTELARAETVQDARDLVSAGRKNLIINGDFRIDQRGGPHTTVTSYHLDRWKFQRDALAEYTHEVTSSTDAPNGFSKSLRLEVISTETSGVSATKDLALTQEMEGQDLQLLAAGTSSAKPFTLSFWVKSTKPGVYCVSVVADPTDVSSGNKIFSTTYKINSASVWEYKTVNIPPCTLTTIRNDTGRGMSLRWLTIAGSSYTGATTGNLHQWSNYHSSLFGGGHETQLITDGDVWQITGVQLEVGKNATEFEHRSYGEELALCQRYYFELVDIGGSDSGYIGPGHWWATDQLYITIPFPVEMRTVPTYNGLAAGTGPGYVMYYSGGATGYLNSSTGRAGIQRLCKTSALTYWQFWKSLSNGTGTTVSGTAGLSGWLERRSGLLRINFSAEL